MYIELRIYKSKDPVLYELCHLGFPVRKMFSHVLERMSKGEPARIRLNGYKSIWCMRTVPVQMPASIHIRVKISDGKMIAYYRALTKYKRNQCFKQALLSSLDPLPLCMYIDNDSMRLAMAASLKASIPEESITLIVSAPAVSRYAEMYNKEAKALIERFPFPEEVGYKEEPEQKEFVRLFRKLPVYKASIDRLSYDAQDSLLIKDESYAEYLEYYRSLYQTYKDVPGWNRLFRKPKLSYMSLGSEKEAPGKKQDNGKDRPEEGQNGTPAAQKRSKSPEKKNQGKTADSVEKAEGPAKTVRPDEKNNARPGSATLPPDINDIFSRMMTM